MAQERETIAFDVVERGDVGQHEIERLAHDVWQSISASHDGACEHPRWLNCEPVRDAAAYTVHRFEGTVDPGR